jgi:hypothetical protein
MNLKRNNDILGTAKPAKIPKEWRDMVAPCVKILEAQVKVEIQAAMTYLAMVRNMLLQKKFLIF